LAYTAEIIELCFCLLRADQPLKSHTLPSMIGRTFHLIDFHFHLIRMLNNLVKTQEQNVWKVQNLLTVLSGKSKRSSPNSRASLTS